MRGWKLYQFCKIEVGVSPIYVVVAAVAFVIIFLDGG